MTLIRSFLLLLAGAGALLGLSSCSRGGSSPSAAAVASGAADLGARRIERLRAIDAEIERTGSWGPLLDAMSDDVTMRATVPEGTPISGMFRGKAEVRRYFDVVHPTVISRFDQQVPTEMVAHGNKVLVLGDDSMLLTVDGSTHRSPYATVYEYDDRDRIRSMLVIQDLSGVAERYRRPR